MDITWALPHSLTAKHYADAGKVIGTCIQEVTPAFRGTTADAQAAVAKLVAAFDEFLASCAKVDAFVDGKIASGEWERGKAVEALRTRRDRYRQCRDELASLETSSLSREEIAFAVSQSLSKTVDDDE